MIFRSLPCTAAIAVEPNFTLVLGVRSRRPKRVIGGRCRHGIANANVTIIVGLQPALLDHLVGAQQERLRDRQPERLAGLEIDNQFKLRRVLHR